MDKNIKLLLILIFLGLLLFQSKTDKVFASPPAPAPRCYVEGVIQKVSHLDALKDNRPGGPTDTAKDVPERYSLKVFINKTSYVGGEESFQSCESLYRVGTIKEIVINKDKIVNNDIPVANQSIKGTVSSFWWPSFDNYILTSTNIRLGFFEKIKAFINQVINYFKS